MVFESFVVNMLNKYLSAYVENLVASQLKIGYWGGDAVLENLYLKGDALKDFNLPFRIKSGFIEKLVLKIPWTNLYRDAIGVNLEGLYILAVPSTSMDHDDKKEAEYARKFKQMRLQEIEKKLTKKMEQNDTEIKKDRFGEKIAVQIIKNIQVHMKSIHFCYEDEITMPGRPFSIGLTLDSLDLQTTNENWIPSVVDQSAGDIFKMVSLNCLAVYLNTAPDILPPWASIEERVRAFKDTIARNDFLPDHFRYIVKPMTISAKLKLSHSQDKLKIMLDFIVQEVGLRLSSLQYHNLMELAESMERMSLNAPFRKFRPDVEPEGNAKLWWRYACDSVLEAGIRRKRRMFSWEHLIGHKHKVRRYKMLFKEKLRQKDPPQDLVDSLVLMEDDLDVFNIMLARQTVELEMVKNGVAIRNKASARQVEENYWFVDWWGKDVVEESVGNIDAIMDENDKKLLYEAIGYSEGEGRKKVKLPEVGVHVQFNLVTLQLQDDKNQANVSLLSLSLKRFTAAFKVYAGSKRMSVETEIKDLQVDGLEQDGIVPHMIMSDLAADANLSGSASSTSLLSLAFEKNPPGEAFDQRFVFKVRPLQIIYDAMTVNSLSNFFRPPGDVQLQRLRAIASSTYKDIREQTITRLKHAIVAKKITDISVKIMSSYIVVPKNGRYLEGCEVIVLDLGEIALNRLKTEVLGDYDEKLEELRSESYDKYLVEVKKIQLLHARRDDDWILNRTLEKSPLHVLEPLNVSLLFQNAIRNYNAHLPQVKLNGTLPQVSLKISNERLKNMVELGASIPLSSPVDDIEDSFAEFHSWIVERDRNRMKTSDFRTVDTVYTEKCKLKTLAEQRSADSSRPLSSGQSMIDIANKVKRKIQKSRVSEDSIQRTDFQVSFDIGEFSVIVAEETSEEERQMLQLSVENFGAMATVRTWDMRLDAHLGSVKVECIQEQLPNGDPMYVINTPTQDASQKLLIVRNLVANRCAPSFDTTYKNTEQSLAVSFSVLEVNANTKALAELKRFSKKIFHSLKGAPDPMLSTPDGAKQTFVRVATGLESATHFTVSVISTFSATDDISVSTKRKKSRRRPSAITQDIISMKIDTVLESFTLNLSDEDHQIASVTIEGITATLSRNSYCTSVEAKLNNLLVTDPFPETLHRQIVSAEGANVFYANIVNYNCATEGDGYGDMKNVDTAVNARLGAMRVLIIRHFIENIVKFGSNFKEAKVKGAGALMRKTRSVMMLIERNPRIKFDVILAVPKVFIPKTLQSLDIITIDLGNVKVTNFFNIVGAQQTSTPAVCDNIKVDVSDMKVSLCQLNDTMEMVFEDQILEPASITIHVKRNLTQSWFHAIPNLAINASMHEMNVKINEVSLGGLLGTMYENLAKLDTNKENDPSSTTGKIDNTIGAIAQRSDTELSEVWDTFKCNFSMSNANVSVFLDQHRQQPLAEYIIKGFSVDIRKGSDKSKDVMVLLKDILLRDARLNRQEGITKYITRKLNCKDPSETPEYIVSMTVLRKPDIPLNIDATIGSLQIIFCLEFILIMNQFMANSMPKLDPKKRKLHPVIRFIMKKIKKLKKRKPGLSGVVTAATKPGKVSSVKKKWKPICMSFKVKQPDIVFVTNIKASETQALVLSMEIASDLNIGESGKEQKFTAMFSNVQLVNCPFSVVQNTSSGHKRVLAPCDVDVKALLSPSVRDFDVRVTKLQITTTPIVIHTIAEALELLAKDKKSANESQMKEEQIELDIWDTKSVSDMQFWFAKRREDAPENIRRASFLDRVLGREKKVSESLTLSVPNVFIFLECGQEQHTVPLLITEMKIDADVRDWSEDRMIGNFKLGLGVIYFNESLSVWEPLVEPVESNPGELNSEYELWTVAMRVQKSYSGEIDSRKIGSVSDLPPVTSITVTSKRLLGMAITNDALKVLKSVSREFIGAAKSKKKKKLKEEGNSDDNAICKVSSAAKIRNMLDTPLNITLGEDFTVVGGDRHEINSDGEYTLGSKEFLAVDVFHTCNVGIWELLEIQEIAWSSKSSTICVRVPGEPNSATFDVSKTGTMMHSLTKSVHVVCEVDSRSGVRNIILRSSLTMKNHLSSIVEVLDTSDTSVCEIAPHSSSPLPEKFTFGEKFCIKLAGIGAEKAHADWAKIRSQNKFRPEKIISCKSIAGHDIHLKIEVSSQKVESSATNQTCYEVNVWPVAFFKNLLPYDIEFVVCADGKESVMEVLSAGTGKQLLTAEMNSQLRVKLLYTDKSWTGALTLETDISELTAWTFKDDQDNVLVLGKQVTYSEGFMKVALYSPYWMVNETGFPIDYKAGDDYIFKHPAQYHDFVLFSFSSKSFLSKHKIQLRVLGSNFSDGFSIKAAGSGGSITCKSKKFNYTIGTQITLARFGLTKVVTFSSYYSIVNRSSQDLEVLESEGNSAPIFLAAKSRCRFWPESKTDQIKICIKGEDSVSASVRYSKLDNGLLVKVGKTALYVDVSVTESSVTVTMKNYYIGSSALMLVNNTNDLIITFGQTKWLPKSVLQPSEVKHYLWPQPNGKREIAWTIVDVGKEVHHEVVHEHAGDFKFKLNNENRVLYYTVFFEGLQRVLLFTENKKFASVVQQGLAVERTKMELSVELQGLSCSVIDTKAKREVLYLAITSSGIVWEEKPKKRWKALPLKYSSVLEGNYQSTSQTWQSIVIDSYKFDLERMVVVRPRWAELRRSFTPGIWLQYSVTDHQVMLHAKIYRLQVDNQLPAATYPVVLHPVPITRSVAIDCCPKPFAELSMMQRVSKHMAFPHVMYFKVLVQEFSVKLDVGLILALNPVLGGDKIKNAPERDRKHFSYDVTSAKITKDQLEEFKNDESGIAFFDMLHLSPIKVHLSLSLQKTCDGEKQQISNTTDPALFGSLAFLLKSSGFTISDMDDVVFKLGYFERRCQFVNVARFKYMITKHYAGQAIKQFYVLVFGLDVIGNPYGLVMGIAEGVTDLFYEPFQGMIQGPSEFFEGLALGAMSLFGRTVGGAAGAMSRVTGVIGRGVASLTMDEEFQKKRQMQRSKPTDAEGLVRGGKDFVMGFVEGVTGVVTKPVEGARKEGATGFIKGVGKGIIGIVTRPAGGVIDLVGNTLEGIQKLADMSEEVGRMRPPRWINEDTGILQPYILRKAQGKAILQEVEKGYFAKDQKYKDHVPMDKDKKSFLLLTDKTILEAHTGDMFGQWNSAWHFTYHEMAEPHISAKGIRLGGGWVKSLCGFKSNDRTIFFHDHTCAKHVISYIKKSWMEVHARKQFSKRTGVDPPANGDAGGISNETCCCWKT